MIDVFSGMFGDCVVRDVDGREMAETLSKVTEAREISAFSTGQPSHFADGTLPYHNMASASQHHQEKAALDPKCIATTGDAFCGAIKTSKPTLSSNIFRQALFSPDGTSIITQNEDNCLRTFVLPPDLLEEAAEPRCLIPHATWEFGSNIQSYALYPGFNLQNPATTLVLTGSAYVPITLRNALQYGTVHATYPLVSSTTEEHLPARSLAFTRTGEHFVVGSVNTLAAFDCTRTGEGPHKSTRLRPGKNAPRTGLNGLTRNSFVSAMSINWDGVLALGTMQREIALYDHDGIGSWSSTFSVNGQGNGVTDVKWSPDGTYLLVAERQSDIVQVFDIRNTQQKVADLCRRTARTTQPLHMSIIQTASGYEVWAGGSDGQVRMWANPGHLQGAQAPDAELHMHDASVTSAVWHPSGAVLATASGGRFPQSQTDAEDSDDESHPGDQKASLPEARLKMWTV